MTSETGDGPLVAVKDLVDVKGTVTTAGGVILPYEPAAEDAPLVQEMRSHRCVVVGKANLHEFAFGVTSANPHYGSVLNPRDPSRVAGGSSGGSAVAVATGMCDWAVGSDTGGSIRVPAALCGVVGFKPTYGSISVLGVVPLSRSLDTMGSLAPSVEVAAAAVEMMGGPPCRPAGAPRPVSDLRLATPAGWAPGLDAGVADAWAAASAGIPEIDLGDRLRFTRCGSTILFHEAAAFHRRWFTEMPEKYGADLRAHFERGLAISNADYEAALAERERLREEMARAMEGLDALLVPATFIVAPLLEDAGESRDQLSGLTRPFNVTGQPVISLPAPVGPGELPVGIQVAGHPGREADLVQVAHALEAAWA